MLAGIVARFFQFAQQFLLAVGQIDRRFDNHVTQQVAMGVTANALDAFATQTELFAVLRAFGQSDDSLALQQGWSRVKTACCLR